VTVYRFDQCELDLGRVELRVAGRPRPVEPQVFEVLAVLVRHHDRLVPKEELLDEVWHHRFVTESALSSRIKSARRAIGDDGRAQRLIRTVHGRGYQFVGEVRAAEAPPLVAGPDEARPSTRRPAPVPHPATPTIGRDGDIAGVVDLLGRERLVTLLGPGGVGKTRLAAEAVLRHADATPVEACFVDLTKVRDPTLVPGLIVGELGFRAGDASDAPRVLDEVLRGRRLVLVLDNFEHVIDAAGVVAEIVRHSPGVQVLVTSRARLRITGERVVDVAPLSLDATDGGPSDAVVLFRQAATAIDGDFRLEPNLADVATICRTVDGLPLAIELAAGHVRTLPPSLLRTRLGARLGSPAGAARDAPARQQTVPATIDWSLQLLGAPERRLFARLGVFEGAVSLEAVEQVCGEPSGGEVVDALSRLVDQSLVRRVTGARGEPRFVLLELLRERARELLAEEDGEAVARRHAAYVTAYLEDTEDRRWTDLAARWVALITEVMGEVRAAHAWAVEHGEVVLAARVTARLGNFWHREGGQREGRGWVEQALGAGERFDAELTARLHLSAGFVGWGDDERVARRHFQAAAAGFRGLGLERQLAYALTLAAATYMGDSAHHDVGMALSGESEATARRLGELPLLTSVLNVKGELLRVHGDDDLARVAYEEGRELAMAIGDEQHMSALLGCVGFLDEHAGRYASARRLTCEALRLCWSAGRRATAAEVVSQLAGPELGLGRPERAAQLLGAADEALRVLGGHRAQGDWPEYDRIVAGLRATLGDDGYERESAQGARLSLDEAVDLGLSEPDQGVVSRR
jgi:predicted ATPase/DNA-binding winged helix-turn-helix (wHTH) protein